MVFQDFAIQVREGICCKVNGRAVVCVNYVLPVNIFLFLMLNLS